jgi:predicted transcriptional regulator
MTNGYEVASKEVVPAARLAIAKTLKERYNMTESSIADILGVAQAAVSKYVNDKCSASVEEMYKKIDRAKIDAYIDRIAKGDQAKLKQCICSICFVLNKFDCKFSTLSGSSN